MTELAREGLVEVEVADGVFYNPRMELSRDLGTAALRAFGADGKTHLDAMCASGIRGLRAAKEAGAVVTLNDADPAAARLAERNAKRNGVAAEVLCRKAAALLFEQRFEVVDVDPFGSPIPALSGAVHGTAEVLAVTATDTAPLCGAHRAAGVRRYMAVTLLTEYHAEVGLRVLVGAVVREAARVDRAARPLFAYSHSHHMRGYFAVADGAGRADDALRGVGFLSHCGACGWRSFASGPMPPAIQACSDCGEASRPIGPLWGGPLRNRDFLSKLQVELEHPYFGKGAQARRLAELCQQELDVPFHYDQHRMARQMGISSGKMEDLLESLRRGGYQASRTHFSGVGFKTDAPMAAIRNALRSTGGQ